MPENFGFELVVVKRFGEAIFPALRFVESTLRGNNAPHHTLIEADNYHALQLLDWLYAGKVDCIYIDPPYNTGAKTWKYNNNYVDDNDTYRHSKWLAMMKRRLLLAMRLLKPTGVMVIAIDDYEMHRLRMLLDDLPFSSEVLGVVPIKNNPAGRTTVRAFAVAHEYAVFIARSSAARISRIERTPEQIARYREWDEIGFFEWTNFRKHGGTDTYRTTRPRQFYPIYVEGERIRIPKMEWNEDARNYDILENPSKAETVLWPIDSHGAERVWDFIPSSALENIKHLRVGLDKYGKVAVYRKWRLKAEGLIPLTWWDKSCYSSSAHGSNLLTTIFGSKHVFQFPKSIYAVRDCIKVAAGNTKDALILDFFAGSGTTLHAVSLLNAEDGGQRRCILVTNNELSDADTTMLEEKEFRPGDAELERHGVCRSVTAPRCKFVITGKRDDGSELPGEYFLEQFEDKEIRRSIRSMDFLTSEILPLKDAPKASLAEAVEFTKSKIRDDHPFLLAEGETVAVLLDPTQLLQFIDAGEQWAETIETVYLPYHKGAAFKEASAQLEEIGRHFEKECKRSVQ